MLQEEIEADRKQRKRAELAESRREEKQIESQIALARELEAARNGTDRAARQDIGDGSSSQQLSVHSREQPLQLSIGAHRGQGEQAGYSGRDGGGRGRELFDDRSQGVVSSEGRAAHEARSCALRVPTDGHTDGHADGHTSRKRRKVRLLSLPNRWKPREKVVV
jgi:hypothetical protein